MDKCLTAKDAYWFRHDANLRDDSRMIDIRRKHAWEGYGLTVGIVEILREQADYAWFLNKLDGLAFVLRVECDLLQAVVKTGIESGFFAKTEADKFHCPMLTENMAWMNAAREARARGGRNRWNKKLSSSRARAGDELNTSNAQVLREEENRKEENRAEGSAAQPLISEQKIEYAPGITMKHSERQELERKTDAKTVEYYIRQCSDYLCSKGETTKDGAAYVRKWMREDKCGMRGYFAEKKQNGRKPVQSNRPERKAFEATDVEKRLIDKIKIKAVP